MRVRKTFKDPAKTVISFTVAVFLISYGIYFSTQKLYPGAFVFGTLGLLFLFIAINAATLVLVSENGIECVPLLGRKKSLKWSEIHEVGILGISLLFKENKGKRNRKYMYFSSEELDENRRFKLMAAWPSSKVPYITFCKKNYELVQLCWQKEIIFYNVGNLDLFLRDE